MPYFCGPRLVLKQRIPIYCRPFARHFKALRENIYTVPNALTVSRIAMTPAIGYLIVTHQFEPSLALLAVAGLTDVVDGWYARKFNQHTFLGSALDPLADKVLMTVLAITLMQAGSLPVWLGSLVLGRDVLLVGGTMVARYATLEKPVPTIYLEDNGPLLGRVSPVCTSTAAVNLQTQHICAITTNGALHHRVSIWLYWPLAHGCSPWHCSRHNSLVWAALPIIFDDPPSPFKEKIKGSH